MFSNQMHVFKRLRRLVAAAAAAAVLGAAAILASARIWSPGRGACGDVLAWVRRHGGSCPKLAEAEFVFQDDDDGREARWWQRVRRRRGVIATETIEAGEEVISVPTSMLISVQAARATPGLGAVLKSLRKELDDFSTLALFLLFESSKGRDGMFWPYVCSLPRPRDMATPIYWPEHKLRRNAVGVWGGGDGTTGVTSQGRRHQLGLLTERMRKIMLHKFNTHVPLLLSEFPDVFPGGLTFRAWVWALSIVYSRNWGIPAHDTALGASSSAAAPSTRPTLVPGCDLLNHHDPVSDPFPCFLEWRGNGTRVAMVARRRYVRGQEVSTNYGVDCNDHFVSTYGFRPRPRDRDLVCRLQLSNYSASLVKTGGKAGVMHFPHPGASLALPALVIRA